MRTSGVFVAEYLLLGYKHWSAIRRISVTPAKTGRDAPPVERQGACSKESFTRLHGVAAGPLAQKTN
jgi:hypothetical protein